MSVQNSLAIHPSVHPEPHGGTKRKVRGSLKLVGVIFWVPWMSCQGFTTIHQIVEIFPSGPKWWTSHIFVHRATPQKNANVSTCFKYKQQIRLGFDPSPGTWCHFPWWSGGSVALAVICSWLCDFELADLLILYSSIITLSVSSFLFLYTAVNTVLFINRRCCEKILLFLL